ncbi:MAG: thioredoxin domain-containing protein [Anaerolineae bacterium]|nr:thioredoxin domain-containing protein [Anaerolineae bacterium]
MGRTRTLERRKEREQQRKRQRQTAVLVGIVVVAVVLVGLILVINQPAEAPIPDYTTARYEGIAQSKNAQGFPVLGSDAAPVKVEEYSSFDCTACALFHSSTFPAILERVRQGQVQFTFISVYGTGSITNGQGAARAAVCAGEQGKFWQMHDALFDWQSAYGNQAFAQNRLASGASNLGIDRGAWDQCMASALPNTVIDAARQSFQLQNVTGTPSIFVNGSLVQQATAEAVLAAIDQAFAQSGGVAAPTTEATPEATAAPAAEATTEAAAPAEATPEATPG